MVLIWLFAGFDCLLGCCLLWLCTCLPWWFLLLKLVFDLGLVLLWIFVFLFDGLVFLFCCWFWCLVLYICVWRVIWVLIGFDCMVWFGWLVFVDWLGVFVLLILFVFSLACFFCWCLITVILASWVFVWIAWLDLLYFDVGLFCFVIWLWVEFSYWFCWDDLVGCFD